MKIIYLEQYFGTPETLLGRTSSYEWARRFVAHGHEVRVVTSDRTAATRGWTESEVDGIRVYQYPVACSNKMSYRRRIAAFFQFVGISARKAATLPGDVVIATSTPLTIALPAAYVAWRKKIPMVLEVADLWPEIPIAVGALRNPLSIGAARWLERFAYRHAAHVMAHSPATKDGVVRAGYPAERVTYVCGNCDRQRFHVPAERGLEFRRQRPWLGDRPLVLYGGALGVINGVDYLARLAAAVRRRNPEIRFLVIGTGREEEKVREEARRLGVLGETFFMEPPVVKKEMPAALSAADLATSVFLDIKEMWANNANKLSDALGAGRPIAINHGGWLAEMIQETGCGLVLDPHDVESAAERVAMALGDRNWLTSARAAADRVAVERFDLDTMAERFESVLLSVVSNRPSLVPAPA